LNARSFPLFSSAVPRALVIGALIVLTQALSSQTTPPTALTLLTRDGRRPLSVQTVGDQEFVALDDLATAFQLAVHEEVGAITVSYKGKTIVLTPDQSLALVSGRLISLPAPPARSGRRWLVPPEFISRALAPVYDVPLELRKPSRLVIVGDLRVPKISVRYDPLTAAGRLTIDATPRATSTVSQDGEHLTVKFDVVNPPLAPQPPQSLVQAVRVVDATTLAVDLGARFAGFKATTVPTDVTMRLVIDVLAAMPTDAAPAPQQPTPTELPPAFAPPMSAIRTIVIDPGHGGDDEGVKGAESAREKDVVLSVARRVKATVEGRLGVRVLLTRDDDRNIPIDERTAIANNNKADLFISLHAYGSMRRPTSGASIFCAAFDADAQTALAAGDAERVPTFGGGLRDIELVPWDLAQTRHIDQSIAFASILADHLRDRVPLAARPVDRAPLRVLEPANMAAVLVEMGYLTNAEQERLLLSDAFQSTFVQAIYDSVLRFRDSLAAAGTQ
jgi:N-acetylmuramoyl-L-alanine amidase